MTGKTLPECIAELRQLQSQWMQSGDEACAEDICQLLDLWESTTPEEEQRARELAEMNRAWKEHRR